MVPRHSWLGSTDCGGGGPLATPGCGARAALLFGLGVCVCAVWRFALVWVACGGRAPCGCRVRVCVCVRCVVCGVCHILVGSRRRLAWSWPKSRRQAKKRSCRRVAEMRVMRNVASLSSGPPETSTWNHSLFMTTCALAIATLAPTHTQWMLSLSSHTAPRANTWCRPTSNAGPPPSPQWCPNGGPRPRTPEEGITSSGGWSLCPCTQNSQPPPSGRRKPRLSWLRVLGVAPHHSWLGSSGVGGGGGFATPG